MTKSKGFRQTPPRREPDLASPVFGGSPEKVDRALDALSVANRYFGGTRSLLRELRRLLAWHPGHPIRMLDVGCGRAEQPRALVEWGRRRGLMIRVVGVDRDPDVVWHASQAARAVPEIRIVRADALRLPFPPRSFDYVTASMLLHYFSWDQARAVLRSLAALSSRALLINDVERHWLPASVIPVLGRLSRSGLFHPGSRDTVLRGFAPDELRRLAAEAGFTRTQVRRHFPFRLTLLVETA